MTKRWGGSVELGPPVEQVWALLLDAERDTGWRRPWVRSVRSLSPGPPAVGSRSETVFRFFGRTSTTVVEITALEPPLLLAWRQVNRGPFVVTGSYRLSSTERGGTRLEVTGEGEGRGTFRPFARPFSRYLGRILARQLAQLRAVVDAQR